MATCAYCGSTIIMGGERDGNFRFCNKTCHENAYVLRAAEHVPADVIETQTQEIFSGQCPRCQGRGPVEVHKIHRVWSALILTHWSSTPQVCCRSCATRGQLGGILFSLLLGWWGFPWGIIFTPVQVGRNIIGLCWGPDSGKPSTALRDIVRVHLGQQVLQRIQSQPPVIPK